MIRRLTTNSGIPIVVSYQGRTAKYTSIGDRFAAEPSDTLGLLQYLNRQQPKNNDLAKITSLEISSKHF